MHCAEEEEPDNMTAGDQREKHSLCRQKGLLHLVCGLDISGKSKLMSVLKQALSSQMFVENVHILLCKLFHNILGCPLLPSILLFYRRHVGLCNMSHEMYIMLQRVATAF